MGTVSAVCGVGGVVGKIDPDAISSALIRMTSTMEHRGPDDTGSRSEAAGDTRWGLCATRLAIQDRGSAGHQPMVSGRTGSTLALNGEIYNVDEVRRSLTERGHAFSGRSDTEVALAAFDEWGLAGVPRLRGMFAMCIWDAAHQRMLLVRDRLGIKPLYYFEHDGLVVFASEVRALLATGLVPPRLSSQGVASYLSLGAVREPDTIIDGVLMLPPGHWGTIGEGRAKIERYWSLAQSFTGPRQAATRRDAVGLVRRSLEAATRRHLVSDVPFGVFLSGGIDSSALAGLVSRVADEPPKTVSVVFEEQAFSEERYMRMIVDRFHTDHTEVTLGHSDFLGDLPAAVAAMDQPTFDGVNTYVVSRAARGAGLTVAHSGIGGDELFAGYDSFRNVPRLDELRRRVSPFATRLMGRAVGAVYGRSDRGRKLSRWLRGSDGDLSAYELQRELFSPPGRAGLVPGARPVEGPCEPRLEDPVNDVSLRELDTYMRNILLRDADVMSMAHSLELRVPFLDHELVELVAPLPGAWKVGGATPKALLVDAVRDLLPSGVYERKKAGFTFPFEDWMRDGLRAEVEGVLLDDDVGGELADALDGSAVRAVWGSFLEGRSYWSRPWAVYVLKAWCERNLRSPVAAQA